jgi:OOP family OmpA-OmpF porin
MKFYNILILSSLLSASLLTIMFCGTAHADDRQVWRDTEGEIVRDYATGTCVREDSSANDACAPQPARVAVYAPPPKRTMIAQEDRTVYFSFNGTALTDESKQRLDTLAQRLTSANDVQGADVAGYADRIGTISYNDQLSRKRAEAVRDYLISRHVVNTNVTQTRWFGKLAPSADCPKDLPHALEIQCLQPDRKVQVDIVYRVEEPATMGQ